MNPNNRLTTADNPVRLGGWTALVVGLALSAVVQWALGADLRVIVGGSASMALSVIGGLEWARTKAWSPSSHDDEMQRAMTWTRASGGRDGG